MDARDIPRNHPPALAGIGASYTLSFMVEAEATRRVTTRTAVIAATVGIVVILGLAVFYVAVVAPLRETHAVLQDFTAHRVRAKHIRNTIARLGGPECATGRLTTYLRLPRWMEADRGSAVFLLGWCGPCAVPTLVETLGDADDFVRAWAALALGRIGPEAKVAVPALVKMLGDADDYVRDAAARALRQVGTVTKEAVPALVKMLGDAEWRVRQNAAWALGSIGPDAKEAVPALEKLLKDSDGDVRAAAAGALKKIRGEQPSPDASSTAPAPEEPPSFPHVPPR